MMYCSWGFRLLSTDAYSRLISSSERNRCSSLFSSNIGTPLAGLTVMPGVFQAIALLKMLLIKFRLSTAESFQASGAE